MKEEHGTYTLITLGVLSLISPQQTTGITLFWQIKSKKQLQLDCRENAEQSRCQECMLKKDELFVSQEIWSEG